MSQSDNESGNRLAWGIILTLSGVVGLIFAGLTIAGWIHGWEGRIALILFALLGLLVSRRVTHRPVLHGFAIGFLSTFIAIELQAAFLPIYFANNPGYAFIEIPFGLSPRFATAIFAPLQAVLGGLLAAGTVWLLCRIIR